jgi:DNA-binding IclR family transcriptional regulator
MNIHHKPTLRTISTLEAVSSGKKSFTLSELSRDMGIPVSTLAPIVYTLREHKFLAYSESRQTYSLGLRLFEIGSRIQSSEFYDAVVECMWAVVNACGETCHFGVLEDGEVLYLAKVDSTQPVRMFSMIGRRLPAYGTAIGKALLRDCTIEGLKQLYPEGLRALTANTITDFDVLHAQLERIRADTFAYEKEESNESIQCVAIPLFQGARVAAALSVAVPVFRYDGEKERLIEELLRKAAAEIEFMIPYML